MADGTTSDPLVLTGRVRAALLAFERPAPSVRSGEAHDAAQQLPATSPRDRIDASGQAAVSVATMLAGKGEVEAASRALAHASTIASELAELGARAAAFAGAAAATDAAERESLSIAYEAVRERVATLAAEAGAFVAIDGAALESPLLPKAGATSADFGEAARAAERLTARFKEVVDTLAQSQAALRSDEALAGIVAAALGNGTLRLDPRPLDAEGANLLALQARQQLSASDLSLANGGDRSILDLFE